MAASTTEITNTPNSNYQVAVDRIPNTEAEYQKVKIELGINGAEDGPISTSNPMPTKHTTCTASSPASATVGTSSSEILASNQSRRGLVIVNTSNADISLAFGVSAVLESGITLTPNGAFSMNEFSYTTQAVHAIGGSANLNLSIQEFST